MTAQELAQFEGARAGRAAKGNDWASVKLINNWFNEWLTLQEKTYHADLKELYYNAYRREAKPREYYE